MMAQAVPNPPPNEKKRVKVYELRNNDWFDRGTGFCTATFQYSEEGHQEDPKVQVQSEDDPERLLLETRVFKEDGFQKQQDTLIVWTEPTTSIDMALSFQEADACSTIWKFINNVQLQLQAISAPEDALSDDISVDPFSAPISLPMPSLGNLHDIEQEMRGLNNTAQGRDALTKFVISEDYIDKLIPLVEVAEDMEDLPSLHYLCIIMKTLILLNDSAIIEMAVTDDLVLGVVGALEYDPDFPSHKANHRQWLGKEGRYKEVVRFDNEVIQRKIHATYRLQYLKDVVLARILDDPTFSVLNSMIFYHQVEILNHIQSSPPFFKELFSIFSPNETDQERKKQAVLFIQQCCAVSKNLQSLPKQQLFISFIGHGLLSVITFALRHSDVTVRVGATDILVCIIDFDPQLIRQPIFRQISEKQTPLTDSLIDLLLVESDLGVKALIADAIKVLLDPCSQNGPVEILGKGNSEYGGRMRSQPDPQQAEFVKDFYDDSAKRLFKPLVDLRDRTDMRFTVHQVSLFIYLIEILCFFVRQHTHHSKYFVLSEKLGQRISQLLSSPEKYLRLTALKFFRNLIGLQDEFYNQQMTQNKLFEPILNMVVETMPHDNLLNSAALEFFEFIQKENVKPVISHLVDNYRAELEQITYVEIFGNFILRYDQTEGFARGLEPAYTDTEEQTPRRPESGRGDRWDSGIKDLDAQEEEYFNTSDNEDDDEVPDNSLSSRSSANGASPVSKPLVDYTSDEENETMENMDTNLSAGIVAGDENIPPTIGKEPSTSRLPRPLLPAVRSPPEKVSEKRRREEEDGDEMSKLVQPKRRSSHGSATSNGIRRKKSFNGSGGTGPKKIAISLSPGIKTGGESAGGGDDG